MESEGKERIARMLDALPSASALKEQPKQLREKRIRLKFDNNLDKNLVRINARLARALGIQDKVEIVVAARTRVVLQALVDENVEEERVYVNPAHFVERGVADNSIATVRASR
ncbi:MAG: hypothetical protein N3D79_06305 [Acidilobaceae archaeon]|nr:hypothetical protein [Acidilobaceae archaeon]